MHTLETTVSSLNGIMDKSCVLSFCCVLMLIFPFYCRGESLDEGLLPSGVLRDDLLFDLSWPGPPESDSYPLNKQGPLGYDSQLSGEEMGGVTHRAATEGVNNKMEKYHEDGVNKEAEPVKLSSMLLPEEEYKELSYVDMRTGHSEGYRCILPQILSWDFRKV